MFKKRNNLANSYKFNRYLIFIIDSVNNYYSNSLDDEMTLFTCMYRWLEEKKKLMVELGEENIELHLDHFITELLPKIRFPMMTPAQLADLLLNPLSQTHTELLVERIRMAMCYHKNQLDISEKGRVSMRCSGIKGTKKGLTHYCSKSLYTILKF